MSHAFIDSVFPFGSQYLRGLTPRPEDWDRDMATMRDLGFNTIRAWLVWGTLEPRQGEVDVAYVRSMLDTAHKYGLRVGLLFHLHGCPEWAIRKHRRYWYVDERGRSFEPAVRANTPSGGWPGLCFDYKQVHQLEDAFITTMIKGLDDHPALAFWEPINEPHQWIDFSQSPPGVFCYCDGTRAAFIDWLRRKYGTLERLNEAWGRRMGEWEEVRPPTWRFGLSDWCDWRTFTAENIAALVHRRSDVIRSCSKKPIAVHAWGGSCVTCTELGSMAFDDWKNADPTDIWGDSAFPQRASSTVLVGLGMAATRSAARGRPFWQAELGTADYHGTMIRTGRLPSRWLEMWSWESIRQGAKGLLYWQFRKERHGNESGAFGLTDYAGNPTQNAHAVARIGGLFNEHRELFARTQPEKAQVAIVFSYQSYMLTWSQMRTCRLNVDAMSGYYRMFWERSIPVDVVHEERITAEALAGYRLVILPMPLALAPQAREAIREYIAQGGQVLSDPYLCAYDADKALDVEVPGGGFAEIFGCHEYDIRQAGEAPVKINWNGQSFPVERSHFQATWTLKGAQVVASYEDGQPCVVQHNWKRGRAILAGLNLGLGAAPQEGVGDDVQRSGTGAAYAGAANLVTTLAREAGVEQSIIMPQGVVASLLRGEDGKHLFITLNTQTESVTGGVDLKRFEFHSGIDLLSQKPVDQSAWRSGLTWEALETRVFLIEGQDIR